MTAFTLRKALRLRNVPFVLNLLPRSRLAESCFRSVGLFHPGWNGSFHSCRFRVSLSVVFSAGRFSPIQEPWVPGYLVSLALALSCGYRCCSCSSHPSPALFSLKTSASWPGCWRCLRLRILSGEHLWVVLPARYPSSASSPSPLVATWSGGSGACLPFFPFSFSFGVFVTPRSMDGELEWAFPSGCPSFSFGVALPPQ